MTVRIPRPLRKPEVSSPYLRHAAAGIQFTLFVLAGTIGGSYLDSKLNGSGIVTFLGLAFGLVCGTYHLLKDFLFPGRGPRR